MQTIFNSEKITRKELFQLTGLTSMAISNPGTTDVLLAIGSVVRTISAFDESIHLAPPAFEIEGDGTSFDINFTVDFASKASGTAVLDYRKIKEC